MKNKFLNVALSIVLTMAAAYTRAQTTYTRGVITFQTSVQGQSIETKAYFTPDSLATVVIAGPAIIRILTNANNDFFAVLVDIAVASIKKAAIYSPDEIKQVMNSIPVFSFSPGTETKQISGFSCKKVVATNSADQKTYDVWITNDIIVPPTAVPLYYKEIGGFPVQYTAFQQGQSTEVTVMNVSGDLVPAGTFSIPPDFDKITKADLEAMSGAH